MPNTIPDSPAYQWPPLLFLWLSTLLFGGRAVWRGGNPNVDLGSRWNH